jgi:hypothetical protein
LCVPTTHCPPETPSPPDQPSPRYINYTDPPRFPEPPARSQSLPACTLRSLEHDVTVAFALTAALWHVTYSIGFWAGAL